MKLSFRVNLTVILLLLCIAGGLRILEIADPPFYSGDEGGQVPAAKKYVISGHTHDIGFWHHPHFGLILIDCGIRLLGDNPYGWRIRNFFLGSLSVLMVFMISMELFSNRRIAFLSGFFMALDPLHIVMSRTTFDEIPAAFFFLVAVYLVLLYLRGRKNLLVIAGMALGFSLSSKSYYAAAAVVLAVFTMIYRQKKGTLSLQDAANIIIACLLVPAVFYVLSYTPWFARGYDLAEFFRLQEDSYRDLGNLTPKWFGSYDILKEGGFPASWFVMPEIFGIQTHSSGGWGTYIIFMNNPPVWFLAIPSTLFLAYRFKNNPSSLCILPLLIFFATYIPLLLFSRPIFIYSAIVLLPFAFIAIAFMVDSLLNTANRIRWIYVFFVLGLFLWSIYLYPLVTHREVPVFLYRKFLSFAKIFDVMKG